MSIGSSLIALVVFLFLIYKIAAWIGKPSDSSKGHSIPKSNSSKPAEISLHVGKTAQEKARDEAERKRIFTVAKDTLALCEGISIEKRDQLADGISRLEKTWLPVTDPKFDELFSLLDGIDWKWLEWEKWRDICIKHDTYSLGMQDYCMPFADTLDLEKERQAYNPDRVFNLMTLAQAKERLSDFPPDVQKLSRAKMIELLKSNPTAWAAVIDPHIKAKWDSKHHYEGPIPRNVFRLMVKTIFDRAREKEHIESLSRFGNKMIRRAWDESDEKLLQIAEQDAAPLWKHPYGSAVPGAQTNISTID